MKIRQTFFLLVLVTNSHFSSSSTPVVQKVDKFLQKFLQESPSAPVNVIVSFKSSTAATLASLSHLTHSTRSERINGVVSALKAHAAASQSKILAYLGKVQGVKFDSFWITNQIYVRGANAALLDTIIAKFEDIAEIAKEKTVEREKLFPVPDSTAAAQNFGAKKLGRDENELPWGIRRIGADRLWELGINGTGIVIASLDSGVMGTHEALRDTFLGNYGWHFPKGINSMFPTDGHFHGTHTTGTMSGTKGIGVAPGSKWMACRICTNEDPVCYLPDIIACAQFFLCPFEFGGANPDCSKAPHVINNSWGLGPVESEGWDFQPAIDAWHAAGLIPVFSIANGRACWQTGYPGNVENVIAVGAIDEFSVIAGRSSLGPAPDERIKPDISAPGAYVWSASSVGDSEYRGDDMVGTSMSCPHVSGAIALMLSYKPDLNFEQIKHYLYSGASLNYTLTGLNCNNVVETRTPNNAFGHGILDAYKSVQLLAQDFPRLSAVVDHHVVGSKLCEI